MKRFALLSLLIVLIIAMSICVFISCESVGEDNKETQPSSQASLAGVIAEYKDATKYVFNADSRYLEVTYVDNIAFAKTDFKVFARYEDRTTKVVDLDEVTYSVKDANGDEAVSPFCPGSYTFKFEYEDKSAELHLTVKAIDISTAVGIKINNLNRNYTYTGSQIKPEITIKKSGETLVKNVDYTIEYGENIVLGEGTITAKGIGNYTGTKNLAFNITAYQPGDVSFDSVMVLDYTGDPLNSDIEIDLRSNPIEGVEWISYVYTVGDEVVDFIVEPGDYDVLIQPYVESGYLDIDPIQILVRVVAN